MEDDTWGKDPAVARPEAWVRAGAGQSAAEPWAAHGCSSWSRLSLVFNSSLVYLTYDNGFLMYPLVFLPTTVFEPSRPQAVLLVEI
jgi:hypothetical protein